MRSFHLTLAAGILSLVCCAATAAADSRDPLVFAVVVGNNDGLGMLPRLNYADDDALRFYRFAVRIASKQNVALLTELDVETWRRIQLGGALPPPFLPPTRQRLLDVIKLFKRQIAVARKKDPRRPVHFFFFFSGHGEKGYFFLKKKDGPLADSAFTGSDLDRTFADSKATLNALFIDACKSQSLFIAKGPAPDDELGPDFSGLIKKLERTSTRAPIGVLTSTVSDKPAGEARDIRGGYFSHVLISGLRGAADSNSDGVIRYGELAAFVSFHTRRIAGQRPWFRPPDGKLDTPLVVLNQRRDLLEIPPGLGGHIVVFDRDGRNLVMELHKTAAQWSRLILTPGRYEVVWVKDRQRGLAARVTLDGKTRRLMLKDFDTPVELGQDRVPKGEGLGAPAPADDLSRSALTAFDAGSSGFDQPFTPRVVSAMAVAYNSGLTALAPRAHHPIALADRHRLALGYGLFTPPMEPLSVGHGLSLSYARRLTALPLNVGGRFLFGFSSHTLNTTGLPFSMYRLALQAEVSYTLPFWRRFALNVGAYAGWQLTMITRQVLIMDGQGPGNEKERIGTSLSGDPAGFRAGLMAELRMDLGAGLWISMVAAGGVDVVHQDDPAGQSQAEAFLRPQLGGQVGYAF